MTAPDASDASDLMDVQPDATSAMVDQPTDTDASTACSPGECACKQRLHAAIADVPPRRHELDVLRMYMGKVCE